jgi:hypothetical protein
LVVLYWHRNKPVKQSCQVTIVCNNLVMHAWT